MKPILRKLSEISAGRPFGSGSVFAVVFWRIYEPITTGKQIVDLQASEQHDDVEKQFLIALREAVDKVRAERSRQRVTGHGLTISVVADRVLETTNNEATVMTYDPE